MSDLAQLKQGLSDARVALVEVVKILNKMDGCNGAAAQTKETIGDLFVAESLIAESLENKE